MTPAVLLLIAAVAAGGHDPPAQPRQSGSYELVDRVAATVERDVITISDVEWEAKVLFILSEGPLNLAGALANMDYVRKILDFLVNQTLVMQEMKKVGTSEFAFTEEEAGEELLRFKSKFQSYPEYARFLAGAGMKEETLRGILVKNSLAERFLNRKLREEITVSGDEVMEFCQKNSAVLPGIKCSPESEQVREVLIKRDMESAAGKYLKDLRGKYRTNVLVDFR